MGQMQDAILGALTTNLPYGIEARRQPKFANTGRIYFQRGLRTVLELSYDFQDDSFQVRFLDVTAERLPEDLRVGYHNGSKPDHGDWRGWYLNYREGEAIERVVAAVKHLLRPDPSANDTEGGTVTANGASWEWIYGVLFDLTGRGLCVVLNDIDTVQLLDIDGDVHTEGATLTYRFWDESDRGYTGPTNTVPLFTEDGEPTITKIHIL